MATLPNVLCQSRGGTVRIRVAVVAALLVVLAGCGGGSDKGGSTGGSDSGGAGGPLQQNEQIAKCDDLVGKPAAQLLDGCTGPNGETEAVVTFSCHDGSDWYAAGDETRMWWAQQGGTVGAGAQDQYVAAHTKCITG